MGAIISLNPSCQHSTNEWKVVRPFDSGELSPSQNHESQLRSSNRDSRSDSLLQSPISRSNTQKGRRKIPLSSLSPSLSLKSISSARTPFGFGPYTGRSRDEVPLSPDPVSSRRRRSFFQQAFFGDDSFTADYKSWNLGKCWKRYTRSLRVRTLIAMTTLILCMFLVVWAVLYLVFPRSYWALELKEIDDSARRFSGALGDSLSLMSLLQQQYVAWDDASNLLLNPEPAQVEAFMMMNFHDVGLSDLKINYTIFYFLDGDLAFYRGFNGLQLPQHMYHIPAPLLEGMTTISTRTGGFLPLEMSCCSCGSHWAMDEDHRCHDETTANETCMMLATAMPVLWSNYSGPVTGISVFLRFVTQNLIQSLANSAQTCATVGSSPDIAGHPREFDYDLRSASDAVTSDSVHIGVARLSWSHMHPYMSRPINGPIQTHGRMCWQEEASRSTETNVDISAESRFAGYTIFADLFSKPALLARVDIPRTTAAVAQMTMYMSYSILLGVGIVFGVTIMCFVEIIVVLPLVKLTRSVREITRGGCIMQRRVEAVGGGGELGFLAASINRMLEMLSKWRQQVVREKEKSEDLLYNMIPMCIAKRLKDGEAVIADSVPHASVLFCDMVGFTSMSSTLSAVDLVRFLNLLFSSFDDLTQRRGLEKIKNIGDAVMIIAGAPVSSATHAADAVELGLDFLDEIERINKVHSLQLSVRVGISSGPLVTGVIGKRKFMFDAWGNTANVASRMESSGVAGCVCISETTCELVKSLEYPLESRGPIPIKGKGDMHVWMIRKRTLWSPGVCEKVTQALIHTRSEAQTLALRTSTLCGVVEEDLYPVSSCPTDRPKSDGGTCVSGTTVTNISRRTSCSSTLSTDEFFTRRGSALSEALCTEAGTIRLKSSPIPENTTLAEADTEAEGSDELSRSGQVNVHSKGIRHVNVHPSRSVRSPKCGVQTCPEDEAAVTSLCPLKSPMRGAAFVKTLPTSRASTETDRGLVRALARARRRSGSVSSTISLDNDITLDSRRCSIISERKASLVGPGLPVQFAPGSTGQDQVVSGSSLQRANFLDIARGSAGEDLSDECSGECSGEGSGSPTQRQSEPRSGRQRVYNVKSSVGWIPTLTDS